MDTAEEGISYEKNKSCNPTSNKQKCKNREITRIK